MPEKSGNDCKMISTNFQCVNSLTSQQWLKNISHYRCQPGLVRSLSKMLLAIFGAPPRKIVLTTLPLMEKVICALQQLGLETCLLHR